MNLIERRQLFEKVKDDYLRRGVFMHQIVNDLLDLIDERDRALEHLVDQGAYQQGYQAGAEAALKRLRSLADLGEWDTPTLEAAIRDIQTAAWLHEPLEVLITAQARSFRLA
jgi:hypothetical protein